VRSRWNFPIYLIYLVISVAVIGFIVAQVGISAPWSHTYSVTAVFSDAADILSNNEVFMNGTKVGHVGDVTVRNGQAQVQLVIDDSRALPLRPNAGAEVRKKNLLGETYIDLQRGSGAGSLADGATIPVSRTVPITEIDQVLAIFDPEAVQRLQLLINALGDATTNNGQNMNAEAASTNQLISALNGPALELSVRQQQVQDIVLELQKFYALLANQRTQIRDGFVTWNQVMAQLANQEASIGPTLQQADTLLNNLNNLVSGEQSNLHSVLANLPTALDHADALLDQANLITSDLAPYRQYIADIFPGLQTSFSDTDGPRGTGNHFWSVYSVQCGFRNYEGQPSGGCIGNIPSTQPSTGSSGGVWAAYSAGGAGQ
jgi:phospholipid/cholesterol/gamma-HCH transport system substrate-binding protein